MRYTALRTRVTVREEEEHGVSTVRLRAIELRPPFVASSRIKVRGGQRATPRAYIKCPFIR